MIIKFIVIIFKLLPLKFRNMQTWIYDAY